MPFWGICEHIVATEMVEKFLAEVRVQLGAYINLPSFVVDLFDLFGTGHEFIDGCLKCTPEILEANWGLQWFHNHLHVFLRDVNPKAISSLIRPGYLQS